MSKELMIERIEKPRKKLKQKEKPYSRGNFVRTIILWQKPDGLNDPNGLIYLKGEYHFLST